MSTNPLPLSLCMIVRSDEERRPPAALRSLHGPAHEADSGSLYLSYKRAATVPAGDRQRRGLLLDVARRALRLPQTELQTHPFLPRLFSLLACQLLDDGDLVLCGRLLLEAAALCGRTTWFTAGRSLLHAGMLLEAEQALLHYLDSTRKAPPQALLPDLLASPRRAWHLLGWLALRSGEHHRARTCLDRALSHPPAGTDGQDDYAALCCDRVRTKILGGQLPEAKVDLLALFPLGEAAGPGSGTHREIMLVSAELAVRTGDVKGALPLGRAAIDPETRDDRGAAMLALLHMKLGEVHTAREMLPLLPGRRYDTLAVRLLLGGAGAIPDVPPATTAHLMALRKGLGM